MRRLLIQRNQPTKRIKATPFTVMSRRFCCAMNHNTHSVPPPPSRNKYRLNCISSLITWRMSAFSPSCRENILHGLHTSSLYTESGSSGDSLPEFGNCSRPFAILNSLATNVLAATGLSNAIYSAAFRCLCSRHSVRRDAIYCFGLRSTEAKCFLFRFFEPSHRQLSPDRVIVIPRAILKELNFPPSSHTTSPDVSSDRKICSKSLRNRFPSIVNFIRNVSCTNNPRDSASSSCFCSTEIGRPVRS